MSKKDKIRTNDPVKTIRQDPEPFFNIASKVRSVKDVEMLSKLSPHIKLQMEELFRHEAKITKQLRDPVQMELFVKDPVRFFMNSKIELSPLIKKRLESFSLEESFESKKFILPNGQVMNPKIKINIKEK